MHLISCALSLIIVVGFKSCSCDVLVYTQATNQVTFSTAMLFYQHSDRQGHLTRINNKKLNLFADN